MNYSQNQWNAWYTTNCVIQKIRFNISNPKQVDIVRIQINSLGLCDSLDDNYSQSQSLQILNKSSNEIKTIQYETEKSVNEMKTQYKIIISTSFGFTIVAIISITFVFLVALLIDLSNCVKRKCLLEANKIKSIETINKEKKLSTLRTKTKKKQ